ncbi:TPA: hypothetical protein N2D04_001087 [Clostridium botulinum]|nr:hypothetical protein [Clostridium botulinum]HCL4457026.1 hypothetical protein [Clostridium botulinum]HCL4460712.1 hypothetical protein [Clostridium botulinum]HCL4471769.1 hypothetical protein [Clostridium botulinum]HCL4479141.1 hypothetical protein [Clostridium botulinum]
MEAIGIFEKQLELGNDPDELYKTNMFFIYSMNSDKLGTNKIVFYYKIALNGYNKICN